MDEFEIQAEIGKGSFATVYKATHLKTDLVVAIKTVNRRKLNRKLAENLETEISILRAATHKNVVLLHNVIRTDMEIHLIMEFCSHGDLSMFIKKKGISNSTHESINFSGLWGGLDEFVIRYFLGQLGCALEFLRSQKIVHRDLKPQVYYYLTRIFFSQQLI
jgi:serine/threonine-protein kinase ULK/ATG1